MAAALGAHLVFDVASGGAGLDQALDGALDVEGGGAKARVDVNQQGRVTHVGDAAHVDQHVVHRVDAQIGQAQRACGHTATRQVDGAVTGAFREQRVVGVDGANDLQRRFVLEGLTEACAGGGECHVGSPVERVSGNAGLERNVRASPGTACSGCQRSFVSH